MRKYFLIFGLGLACLLTSSVFANGKAYVLHQPACYAIPGWVIGADIGWGYLDTPTNNLFFDDGYWTDLSQSHDIGDIVWGIHGGRTFGITPNMLLGFEVGYKDLGKSKYKSKWTAMDPNDSTLTRKVDQQAIDVLLTGNYFVWQGFNLFAKAGMAYVESTTKQTFSGSLLCNPINYNGSSYYNTKESIWRLRPEVILGMGYMFNNHVDVHVLYDYIYGVTETKWNGIEYENGGMFFPPKPRTYSANLVMGGISYTF